MVNKKKLLFLLFVLLVFAVPTSAVLAQETCSITGYDKNIRFAPSLNGEIVDRLNGTVAATGQNGDWWQIGENRWVNDDVVQKSAGCPNSPSLGTNPSPDDAAITPEPVKTVFVAEPVAIPAGEHFVSIPAIGVHLPVTVCQETGGLWDVSQITYQACWLSPTIPGTSYIHRVLAAHSTDELGNRAAFYLLHRLQPGDEIFVSVGETSYRFIVTGQPKTVSNTALSEIYVNGALTLITCDPKSLFQDGVYANRTVVVAYPG